MKSMVRMALLLCLLAVPAAQLMAQINFYSNDMRNKLAVGQTVVRTVDTITTQLNIGKRGGSNTWHFDSLKNSQQLTFKSVTVASTPYTSEFPAAKWALQLQTVMKVLVPPPYNIPVTLQNVDFYSAIDTAYRDMGLRGTIQEIVGAIGRWMNVPADTSFVFPFTLGSKWTSTFHDSLQAIAGILGTYQFVKGHVDTSTVDAWGTMTLPGSSTAYDALRIRTVDHVTPLIPAGNPSTAIWYTFVSKNGAMVKFGARDTAQADSGLIFVARPRDFIHDPQWDAPNVVTDVPLAAAVPSEFTLQQNYPNPFNPSTTIRYSVPQHAMVTLSVYNLLGQQVAQLVSGDRDRGTYEVRFDASALPSGTYFYRLTAGSFVETRRMMLVK